jgi:hypothetical protein
MTDQDLMPLLAQLPQSGDSGASVASSSHNRNPFPRITSAMRFPLSIFSAPVKQAGPSKVRISRGGLVGAFGVLSAAIISEQLNIDSRRTTSVFTFTKITAFNA